jgi:hypothetical protein
VSTLRVVSSGLPDGNVQTVLTCPHEILERINNAEETLGEQRGALMRDKLLQAVAAMVIQSLDEFRSGPIFSSQMDDLRIAREREEIKQRGGPPDIGTGEEPLEFGGRVK